MFWVGESEKGPFRGKKVRPSRSHLNALLVVFNSLLYVSLREKGPFPGLTSVRVPEIASLGPGGLSPHQNHQNRQRSGKKPPKVPVARLRGRN